MRLMVCLSFLVSALCQGPLSFSLLVLKMYTMFERKTHTLQWGNAPPGLFAECAQWDCLSFQFDGSSFSVKQMGDFFFSFEILAESSVFKHTIDVNISVFCLRNKGSRRVLPKGLRQSTQNHLLLKKGFVKGSL